MFYSLLQSRWTRPNHPAIVTDAETVDYRELQRRVRCAAAWLHAKGLRAGDVAAIQMPKSLAFLELHLAGLATGITTLPLNTSYTDRELAFFLDDSKARLAVLLDDRAPNASCPLIPASTIRAALDAQPDAPLPAPCSENATAILCYTSGTTGRPKGAVISHRNLRATVEALHQAWRWSDADRLLHGLPLYHIHGLFVAQHGALHAGASTRWLKRFEPTRAMSLLESWSATVFMGVPTFYNRFMSMDSSTWNLTSMRLFTSGSAPLPAAVHRAFEERFGHRVLERYGMTEVGIVLSNPYEGERRPGAVGFPLPGVEARVVDGDEQPLPAGEVGEIRIRGASVIAGYLGLPDKTEEALGTGWMKTGDLGFVSEDGYFHVVGRDKDMIISGGLNVYPREVESVLLEHPGVAEVAVVGAPDPDWGERVVATIVPVEGVQLDVEELLKFARHELAGFKCPKQLELVDALPRNSMGKVQKTRLRDAWATRSG